MKLHTKFHVNYTAGLFWNVQDISIVIIVSIAANRPCMLEQTISKLIHLLTVEMATVPLGLYISEYYPKVNTSHSITLYS